LTLEKISLILEGVFETISQLFSGKKSSGKTVQPIIQLAESQYVWAILSAINDGIIVVDTAKNILVFNKAAEAMTGFASVDAVGKQLGSLLQFFFQDQEQTNSIFGTASFSHELTVKPVSAKGAIAIAARVISSPIHKDGVPSGWVIAVHDMRFEQQLSDMKFGFVSIAAHELRTPLTAIKGAISVLVADYKDIYNQDQTTLLGQVSNNTERLLILVENLLNVSRIERGTVELSPTSVDWITIVKQIMDDFAQRAIEKNITLSLVPPTEPISFIRADRVRIGEVLSNLLSNAITYTNPSGKVTVAVEKKENEVWTSVTDTGRGIPPDALTHLFTKFYRVNKGLTSEMNSHGTGLGLYISKAIVEMHKGRIWVTSEFGKGSTFIFALPL